MSANWSQEGMERLIPANQDLVDRLLWIVHAYGNGPGSNGNNVKSTQDHGYLLDMYLEVISCIQGVSVLQALSLVFSRRSRYSRLPPTLACSVRWWMSPSL